MSDLFENNKNELEQSATEETINETVEQTTFNEEESTVFSAPNEHKYKAPKQGGKNRLLTIIGAFLAVAILVGGTLAVIKYIPEMNDDESPDAVFEDITVVDSDSTKFSSVTVKNSNGEFKFVTQQVTSADQNGQDKTTAYWTIENIDYSKLSSSSMQNIITSAANVIALRETSKPADECGFDKPTVKVTVESTSNDPYTFIVGNKSPDGIGYYLKLEGKDTIYITPNSEFKDFEFSLLDITDSSVIPITTFSVDTSGNKVSDGTYAYFDSLVLSGKLYPNTLTITNNPDTSESAKLTPYLVSTPMKRYANTESLVSPIDLFSKTTSVVGNYALDITDETLRLFGLDDPDVVITMTIGGEAKTFKFAKVDETYSAVVYDGAKMIRKVETASIAFLNLKTEDFYFKSVFMCPISDLSTLTIDTAEDDIKFDVSYEEDSNGNRTYEVIANGTKIEAKNFQNYYSNFMAIQCSNFKLEKPTSAPDCVITFTHRSGINLVVDFYRINETEYQYSIDGVDMGRIPSSEYVKMIKNLKTVASGGAVS